MTAILYGCDANHQGGQIHCERCGYTWDLDDEAPRCLTVVETDLAHSRQRLNRIREEIGCKKN